MLTPKFNYGDFVYYIFNDEIRYSKIIGLRVVKSFPSFQLPQPPDVEDNELKEWYEYQVEPDQWIIYAYHAPQRQEQGWLKEERLFKLKEELLNYIVDKTKEDDIGYRLPVLFRRSFY